MNKIHYYDKTVSSVIQSFEMNLFSILEPFKDDSESEQLFVDFLNGKPVTPVIVEYKHTVTHVIDGKDAVTSELVVLSGGQLLHQLLMFINSKTFQTLNKQQSSYFWNILKVPFVGVSPTHIEQVDFWSIQ